LGSEMRRPVLHSANRPRWTALFLVLLLAVLLLPGCSYLRRRRASGPPYRKLSPPVAFELIRDNPGMLVLDLRPPQEFDGATGHIRGASNIPLQRLPYRLLEISSYREETFLVYCRADGCGAQGMSILLSSGFENAILMDGGIDSWIRSGFRTVLPQSALGRPAPAADGKGPTRPLRPGEPEAPEPEVDVPRVPPPVLEPD
jgi:rhodanese-related sulfurtransferase